MKKGEIQSIMETQNTPYFNKENVGDINKVSGNEAGELKYRGMFQHINEKPTGEYIEIFVSNWNKDYWGLYAYIDGDNYEEDIEKINNLITELNYRDGDVYIELINHSDGLEGFYKYIYDSWNYPHSAILNPEYWEILEEKGDNHFLYFSKLNGSGEITELKDAEYIIFEDWYSVLENIHPDLYKALDENGGFSCFNIEQFYNCCNLYEIQGVIVEEIN